MRTYSTTMPAWARMAASEHAMRVSTAHAGALPMAHTDSSAWWRPVQCRTVAVGRVGDDAVAGHDAWVPQRAQPLRLHEHLGHTGIRAAAVGGIRALLLLGCSRPHSMCARTARCCGTDWGWGHGCSLWLEQRSSRSSSSLWSCCRGCTSPGSCPRPPCSPAAHFVLLRGVH
jgi:hypothetical protein